MEMMLVMFITVLLVGTVFGIIQAVTQFTTNLQKEQLAEAKKQGLAEMYRRTFLNLPAHAFIRLRTKQSGNQYLSELTLVDAPGVLDQSSDNITVWETEELAGGQLRLVLRILTKEEATAWNRGQTVEGLRVMMMEEITKLEWHFYNERSKEWEPVWNENLPLPVLVEASTQNLEEPVDKNSSEPEPDPTNHSTSTDPRANTLSRSNKRPSLVKLTLVQGVNEISEWWFWIPPAR